MTAKDAREYLVAAAATLTGRQILRDLGFGAIIATPADGDDRSTQIIATKVLAEFQRRYPTLV